jgi:hypothetical protein
VLSPLGELRGGGNHACGIRASVSSEIFVPSFVARDSKRPGPKTNARDDR